MKRLAIIGAGKGGCALLETLHDDPFVSITAIADHNSLSEGLRRAELLGIPTYSDYKVMLAEQQVDVIINVTGKKEVDEELAKIKSKDTEIVGGLSAHLMWQLIEERRRGREETRRRLSQFEDLYRLGLLLSSSQDPREVNYAIIDYATKLTSTPAGSLAVLDQNNGEMVLGAAKGFSTEFFEVRRWKLRKGGLTSYILNQKSPVVINDLEKYKAFENQILIKEKIKSLIASPLTVEGKIVGILYVDDFCQRRFTTEDVYTISLISTYAALAIERVKLMEDTRLMAITDGLTGLYNHRHFLSRLEEEIERARRYNHHLSLVTFDIDYFKKYNDNQGHLRGNDALREISSLVKDTRRQIDICARCGGEEFAIIMPETTKGKAYNLAERLRKKVEDFRFEGEEQQPNGRLTISVGVAGFPEDCQTMGDLLDKADQALYEAKKQGRNQVVSYQQKKQLSLTGREK